MALKSLPKNLDSTDGLAAAVCHFYNAGRLEIGTTYTGWEAFVKAKSAQTSKGGFPDAIDLRKNKK